MSSSGSRMAKTWSFLVLIIILLSHFALVISDRPTALAEEAITTRMDSLCQGLAQKGIAITPGEAGGIINQADDMSVNIFGDNLARRSSFTDKLLDLYVQAAGEDVVIIATPGGWGVDPDTQGGQWLAVIQGMQSTLEGWGYTPVIVDYLRMESRSDILAYVKEIQGIFRFFSPTAPELAAAVELITQHNPQTTVILTGLSHGAAYVDAVMKDLQTKPQVNQQVLGIGGGPPFYHVCLQSDRILMLRNNGRMPDNWSQGNRWVIIKKYITGTIAWLADKRHEHRKYTKLAFYIQTPGHEYNWSYPDSFSTEVVDFLQQHLSGNT